MAEIIRLGNGIEETAYHEAGHAAIELIHGFEPQLLTIEDRSGDITGNCYSCTSGDFQYRAEKAVAGVLSQALYVGKLKFASQAVAICNAKVGDLVTFFLEVPAVDRHCLLPLVDSSGASVCSVDLRGGYSRPDFLHFRNSIVHRSKEKYEARKFQGNEDECRAIAAKWVTCCIVYLNDTRVWKDLGRLANVLLTAEPATTRSLNRDQISQNAGLLSTYFS